MGFYKIFATSYRLSNIFSSRNIKKILLFIIIGLVLFLLFSNNAYCVEDVTVSTIQNARVKADGSIISDNDYDVYYFNTEKYYCYTITNNGLSGRIFYSEDVPNLGDTVYTLINSLADGDSYTFISDGYYVLCARHDGTDFSFTITRDYLDGYKASVGNMTDVFSVSNLWDQLGFAVPIIGVAVLFALGFMVVRKSSKGVSKSKVKF